MDRQDKLDKIAEDVAGIRADLNYHIRRTDLLEEQLKPVQDHVLELKGVVKALKFLAVIASIIEGIHYLIK